MQQKYDIVELEGCSIYCDGQILLKDISLNIADGAHLAIIGPNGSGKTTLLKVISGFEWPSSGSVKVLGKEFGSTDLRELRKKIGWVTTFLLEKIPLSEKAIDVVISGKFASFGVFEKTDEADIEKAEELLGFMEIGYLKDRKLRVISQGETQKVLIARALMADPLLLILDEPCTGLDIKARKVLLGSVSKICREKTTVIYVTHHFDEIVPEIKNMIMVKEGGIFMQGNKDDLLKKELLDKLFE